MAALKLDADDHRQGMTAQSPIELFIGFVVFAGFWIVFSLLQISATQDAVFGFLQLGVRPPSTMNGQQILDFVNGSLDRNHMIASAIAWAVQLFLFGLSMPSDRQFLHAHKKHNHDAVSKSVADKALLMAKIKSFVTFVLVGGDILTDFLYAAYGHSLIAGFSFIFIPNIGNWGALLVAFLYPIAICGVTVFAGAEAFRRFDGFIAELGKRSVR